MKAQASNPAPESPDPDDADAPRDPAKIHIRDLFNRISESASRNPAAMKNAPEEVAKLKQTLDEALRLMEAIAAKSKR